MEKDQINAMASDVFNQAADGLAVEIDPELADAMGAFTEDAVALQDVMTDILQGAEDA